MNTDSQNQVQLLGRLGQDVDLRELAQGRKLARLSIATDEFKSGANGPAEKVTTWHNLIAWGKTAEDMGASLQKGQKVYIEGKIQHRTYETKTGEKRYATEILVTAFKKVTGDITAAENIEHSA